jgi:hypothetical protein
MLSFERYFPRGFSHFFPTKYGSHLLAIKWIPLSSNVRQETGNGALVFII